MKEMQHRIEVNHEEVKKLMDHLESKENQMVLRSHRTGAKFVLKGAYVSELKSIFFGFSRWTESINMDHLSAYLLSRSKGGALGMVKKLWNETRLRRLELGLSVWWNVSNFTKIIRRQRVMVVSGATDMLRMMISAADMKVLGNAFLSWMSFTERNSLTSKNATDTCILMQEIHESRLIGAARYVHGMICVTPNIRMRWGMRVWREAYLRAHAARAESASREKLRDMMARCGAKLVAKVISRKIHFALCQTMRVWKCEVERGEAVRNNLYMEESLTPMEPNPNPNPNPNLYMEESLTLMERRSGTRWFMEKVKGYVQWRKEQAFGKWWQALEMAKHVRLMQRRGLVGVSRSLLRMWDMEKEIRLTHVWHAWLKRVSAGQIHRQAKALSLKKMSTLLESALKASFDSCFFEWKSIVQNKIVGRKEGSLRATRLQLALGLYQRDRQARLGYMVWRWREAVAVRRGLRGSYMGALQNAVATRRACARKMMLYVFHVWLRVVWGARESDMEHAAQVREASGWSRVLALNLIGIAAASKAGAFRTWVAFKSQAKAHRDAIGHLAFVFVREIEERREKFKRRVVQKWRMELIRSQGEVAQHRLIEHARLSAITLACSSLRTRILSCSLHAWTREVTRMRRERRLEKRIQSGARHVSLFLRRQGRGILARGFSLWSNPTGWPEEGRHAWRRDLFTGIEVLESLLSRERRYRLHRLTKEWKNVTNSTIAQRKYDLLKADYMESGTQMILRHLAEFRLRLMGHGWFIWCVAVPRLKLIGQKRRLAVSLLYRGVSRSFTVS